MKAELAADSGSEGRAVFPVQLPSSHLRSAVPMPALPPVCHVTSRPGHENTQLPTKHSSPPGLCAGAQPEARVPRPMERRLGALATAPPRPRPQHQAEPFHGEAQESCEGEPAWLGLAVLLTHENHQKEPFLSF